MSSETDPYYLRLHAINWEVEGIHSYDLRPPAGGTLPAFTAGAHIDLHLANGMVRSYSLVNPQDERHRYVVMVQNDRASRGGSRHLHDSARVGDRVAVSGPRNNFPLVEDAGHILLLAGGIGITPLWCMIQRLRGLGRSFELHYCARSRGSAAFRDKLVALQQDGAAVAFNFDGEPGGKLLDIGALVAKAAPETHLYCCGPLPMLAAFEAATASRPPGLVHLEYFTAKDGPASTGGFTVVLARTGRSVMVPPGRTILETLLDEGLDLPSSCLEGVCGTCETKVLEGVPDHRDVVLTQAEREANRSMMICCSGCKSEKLVLDI